MTTAQSIDLACHAAGSAAHFAVHLADRYQRIVDSLRSGSDEAALTDFDASTHDLESFLQYLILVNEYVDRVTPNVSAELLALKDRILNAVEGLEPSLGDIDLVEVADALEDDLVPSLHGYADLDPAVRDALGEARSQ